MRKIRWGVLSTAKIGVAKVIPAMQRAQFGTVDAIASRDAAKGRTVASQLGIARVHESYEALLADAEIDAVYIPLPNHLHVPWTRRALEAGKHVLCEKPIALTAAEAIELVAAAARFPRQKVMEAFMYRFHPQWQKTRELVLGGAIGELRTVHAHFSYWNVDPQNIRNRADVGGGAMMDIGCYCVSFGRWLFEAEPQRVLGLVDRDPGFGTDRLASGVLDFGRGTTTFTCSTQLSPYQRATIHGTQGRIEIEIPVNAPPDQPTRLWLQRGTAIEEVTFAACDQYTLQADAFARAILDDTPVPTPLTDAVGNMRVIEAVFASAREATWVELR
ncbi:Gfo/Idh/MocA family protein [Opitutus terrae]|uniref:Oxidoreductase domain protein n=1 Tax=Opitutus terrae (strain DSM 11246 / JCM 15787 / PB90-1) TaxID=452637 RepID=B1ZQE8_OPITP|nr:Gfo/Idh/MocA family oxidoreductase [Opitutus terrae]ACB73628.1 oxidoreductase domain protein [Opitutus terrae PB90-1]